MQESNHRKVCPFQYLSRSTMPTLLTVRGLSRSTRSLHHHVVSKHASLIAFSERLHQMEGIRFNDFVQFLTSESPGCTIGGPRQRG